MTNLFQSKSMLAKLLAQENLSVDHRNTSTAYFDLKSRSVVLPFWKDMSGDTYDLLVGHEVGHGLFTPAEGWHNALEKNKAFKSYLNVVEDARIERLMKDKYPGLRRSFNIAYKKLNDDDFFGLKGRDVNMMRVIDRINVFYKLGAHYNVVFTPEEMVFIDRINAAKTFDDVRDVATDIYEYAKGEKRELEDFDDIEDSMVDADGDEFADDDFDGDDGDGGGDGNDSEDDSSDPTGRNMGKKASHSKEEQEQKEQENLESETDRAFRNAESRLVDSKNGNTYIFDCPKYNSHVVVPYKLVYQKIDANIALNERIHGAKNLRLKNRERTAEFLNRVNSTVNYMVKEFEVRKNASQMARAKTAKSGKINPKKLARYNISNDIFQRITSVPEGKNHGMVIVIDLSASMANVIQKTFEQAIVLTQFCRKVNIPFDVYGFTDNWHALNSYKTPSHYESRDNDLHMHNNNAFKMKHYLSSNMPSSQYKSAVDSILYATNLIQARYTRTNYFEIPIEETLHGTPLNEAIAASIDIVSEFKAKNKLEIVNCIFLTDGCGGSYFSSYKQHAAYDRDAIYVEHKETKLRVKYRNELKNDKSMDQYSTHRALIELAQQVTGAKYTGYYIGSPRDIANFLTPYEYNSFNYKVEAENRKLVVKDLRENGFLSSNKFGFDEFFFVHNENLEIKEFSIDVGADATKGKIARAFSKTLNSRGLQRMFLNKFVQNIAA